MNRGRRDDDDDRVAADGHIDAELSLKSFRWQTASYPDYQTGARRQRPSTTACNGQSTSFFNHHYVVSLVIAAVLIVLSAEVQD